MISCSRRAITADILGIQASRDDIIQPVLIGCFSLGADGDRWARQGRGINASSAGELRKAFPTSPFNASSLAQRMSCVSWQRRLEEEEVLQHVLERWEQSTLRNHVDPTVEFMIVFTFQGCIESRS